MIEPADDVIAKAKRVLAAVDTYVERPDRMNRNTLRAILVDELRASASPTQAAPDVRRAMFRLSAALGHPQTVDAALIELAANRLTRGKPARRAQKIGPPAVAPAPLSAEVMDAAARNGLAWAVSRWQAEVSQRPLVNVHRRTLDDTWRQVIHYFGGDPGKLIGLSHDVCLEIERIDRANRKAE